jgi:hypothetical protein
MPTPSVSRALGYWAAQLAVALTAAAPTRASLGEGAHVGATLYVPAPLLGTSLGGLAYQLVRGAEPA